MPEPKSSISSPNISPGGRGRGGSSESKLAKQIESLKARLEDLSGPNAAEQKAEVNSLTQKLSAITDPTLLKLKAEQRRLTAEITESEIERQSRELQSAIAELEQKRRQRDQQNDPEFRKLKERLADLKEELEGDEQRREREELLSSIEELEKKKKQRNFEQSSEFRKLKDKLAKLQDEVKGSEEDQQASELEEQIAQLKEEKKRQRAVDADPKVAALQEELKQLRSERAKQENVARYRELEDEIANIKEDMEKLNDESAQDEDRWERRRGKERGKLAGGYSRDLDVEQAFNFNRSRQRAFGYVTMMAIGPGAPLLPDFTEMSPLLPGGTANLSNSTQTAPGLPVVGALASVRWELGTEDPIEFSLRISAKNQAAVLGFQYKTAAVVDVKIAFAVYEYSQASRNYYVAFGSAMMDRGSPIMGQIVKSTDRQGLDLEVGFEPATEVWAPQNFLLRFSMRPKTLMPQTLYLGTSPLGKMVKTWG